MSLTTGNDNSVLDLTGTTESIEQSHIGSGTRSTHINHLIMLMMYFFDNNPSKLKYITELESANSTNLPRKTTKSRKQLRDECRRQLLLLHRDNSEPIDNFNAVSN